MTVIAQDDHLTAGAWDACVIVDTAALWWKLPTAARLVHSRSCPTV